MLCPGAERERGGDCLAGLVLLSESSTADAESLGTGREEKRYTYTFGRSSREHGTLTDAGFSEGDHIVLSIDGEMHIMTVSLLQAHIRH